MWDFNVTKPVFLPHGHGYHQGTIYQFEDYDIYLKMALCVLALAMIIYPLLSGRPRYI